MVEVLCLNCPAVFAEVTDILILKVGISRYIALFLLWVLLYAFSSFMLGSILVSNVICILAFHFRP